ncbi:MAG: SIMPL domain-containing protein [Porticoccaceae bacterium]|nr:SIMPL domain-containing protein [Porticoccaceae bacterium]
MTRHSKPLALFCAALLTAFAATAVIAADQPRTLSTSGHGEVKVAADQATVRMQVETSHRSASDAKRAVDDRVNQLLERLSKLGIDRKDIVASSLRLNPQFEYQERRPVFTGYNATRDVVITLRKLDELNDLLDAAVDSGINQINQIALESSQADTHRAEARARAIADSQAKAELLAKSYGAALGPVHTIHYHNSQPMTAAAPEMAMMRMAADSVASSPGQYLHDEITFRDNISVVYELIISH